MPTDVTAALKTFFDTAAQPVVFLGAGVSAKAGLPTWVGLLEKMADFLQAHNALESQMVRDQVRRKNYTKAATCFEIADAPEGDKNLLLRNLLDTFDANALVPLAKLPFKTVLTTNFDRSIHNALAAARQASPQDYKFGDISFRDAVWETSLMVARIHGAA